MKKILAFLLVFSMVFGMNIFVSKDKAASISSIIDENEEELVEGFTDLGIDEETQEELLDKLRDGELLDSIKEENMDVDLNKGLNTSEIIVYPDGSRAEVGVELLSFEPEEGGEEFSIAGSHKKRDPGKYSVRVFWNSVIANQSFYADFQIKKGANNDTITRIGSYSSTTVGAKKTSERVWRARSSETSTRYAHAIHKVEFDFIFSIGSSNQQTNLFVGNNGYKTSRGSRNDLK